MPVNEKTFEQQIPRYLEEEGFYVGTPPIVPQRNRNKMEHRLLHEPDKVTNVMHSIIKNTVYCSRIINKRVLIQLQPTRQLVY